MAGRPRDIGYRSLPDFHTAPGHLLRRARQFHDALWQQRIGEQLTPLQYAMLTALATEPGLDQKTLGERIAVDKSTVGDLIARLVRRGQIVQHIDPADGRRRIPAIAPQGLAALTQAAREVHEVGRDLLAPLSPDERQELLRLLDKLVYSPEALADIPQARSGRDEAH